MSFGRCIRASLSFSFKALRKEQKYFLKKQNEYFSNKSFNEIRTLLDKDDEKLKEIPIEEKRAYLTFFEEVAVLRNTGLIKPDVACWILHDEMLRKFNMPFKSIEASHKIRHSSPQYFCNTLL